MKQKFNKIAGEKKPIHRWQKPLHKSYSRNRVPSRKLEKTKFTRRSLSNASLRLAHLLRRTKRRRPRSFRPLLPLSNPIGDLEWLHELYDRRSIIFYLLRFSWIFGIFLFSAPHIGKSLVRFNLERISRIRAGFQQCFLRLNIHTRGTNERN